MSSTVVLSLLITTPPLGIVPSLHKALHQDEIFPDFEEKVKLKYAVEH